MSYLIYALLGFMSGGILFSYLIAKVFCGVDITVRSDDGNPGAANVFELCGLKYGVAALLLDILKGIIPVFLASQHLDITKLLFVPVLVAPVLGHAFSPYYRLQGGKAIAVSFGCMLGLIPNSFIVLGLAFTLVIFTFFIIIKPNRLRCIISYSLFTLYCMKCDDINTFRYGCIIIALIVILKHVLSYDREKLEVHLIIGDKWLHRS